MEIDVSHGKYSFSVSSKGAYLSTLRYEGRSILKPASDKKETHGGCAQLIPFANRVRNATFNFEGREIKLGADDPPNAIHGLTRNMDFQLAESGNGIVAEGVLSSNDFPWVYMVRISYSVSGNEFKISYKVKNESEKTGPLMIGAHPYLYFSGDWKIESNNMKEVNCLGGYFPTGKFLGPINEILPRPGGYDNPFIASEALNIHLGDHKIILNTEKMPYFMLYDGKYCEGKSIAVEPMTGAPDCFNNGMGLIGLGAGKTFRGMFSLKTEWSVE